jgi:hypothetical protein
MRPARRKEEVAYFLGSVDISRVAAGIGSISEMPALDFYRIRDEMARACDVRKMVLFPLRNVDTPTEFSRSECEPKSIEITCEHLSAHNSTFELVFADATAVFSVPDGLLRGTEASNGGENQQRNSNYIHGQQFTTKLGRSEMNFAF